MNYGNPVQSDKASVTGFEYRVLHALSFSRNTLGLLAEEGYDDPDTLQDKILPEKVIGETAFLLYAASLVEHAAIKDKVFEIAQILAPYARSKKILLGICLYPALAIEFAQAHVFLTRIGYPDNCFDRMLDKSISAQSHFGRERPPHRMLEQEWVKRVWTGSNEPAGKRISDMITNSALSYPVDLLHGTREDLYAFTHALMYATCFNISPWKIGKKTELILEEAEAMLARCIDEQDYDLAGELLLAWPLTGSAWSPLAVFAFQVLMRVEDEAGFLPSPATRIDTLQKLEGEKKKKYLHATAYHTVYVMGLLCSASLQTGMRPPSNISANKPSPKIPQKVLEFLRAGNSNPHWLADFDQLEENEKNPLADLLLNIALYRSVQQKQYDRVFELIQIAYEEKIGSSALVTQAAELLGRLSQLTSFG
ncbi:hypothetical protein [Mucilaginibacter sp. BT774]|uniref:DUF6895 family protein n=1 Tax=Mucilaginibacter sp. BT774 TaxID=3062276 RepID=UPI002676A3A3|nr:hypothetical protein [Mucilaginibacter sp. BT774]MDO3627099.1 hypothetical protein [Mucilaginibacter sp. BT774]